MNSNMTKQKIANKLKDARASKGYTQQKVAELLQRPQQTIAAWESGRSQPDTDTLGTLLRLYGVSPNNFFEYENNISTVNTPQEKILIKKYRNLDDHGKKIVDIVLNEETERMSKEAENKTPVIDLRRYFAPVSAGTGVELEPYENFENIEVYSNVYTRRASFCLTVRGDSMEPRFHNDDIIMVAELEDVEFGDIGVFIVDGQGYLKIRGEYDLISLNPAYDNIHVSYEQMNRAIGKVIGVLDPDWIKSN